MGVIKLEFDPNGGAPDAHPIERTATFYAITGKNAIDPVSVRMRLY